MPHLNTDLCLKSSSSKLGSIRNTIDNLTNRVSYGAISTKRKYLCWIWTHLENSHSNEKEANHSEVSSHCSKRNLYRHSTQRNPDKVNLPPLSPKKALELDINAKFRELLPKRCPVQTLTSRLTTSIQRETTPRLVQINTNQPPVLTAAIHALLAIAKSVQHNEKRANKRCVIINNHFAKSPNQNPMKQNLESTT